MVWTAAGAHLAGDVKEVRRPCQVSILLNPIISLARLICIVNSPLSLIASMPPHMGLLVNTFCSTAQHSHAESVAFQGLVNQRRPVRRTAAKCRSHVLAGKSWATSTARRASPWPRSASRTSFPLPTGPPFSDRHFASPNDPPQAPLPSYPQQSRQTSKLHVQDCGCPACLAVWQLFGLSPD